MKRDNSAFKSLIFLLLLLGISITPSLQSKAAKVDYSLPELSNFNISLSNPVLDKLPNAYVPGKNGVKIVVLDAGHGGKDPGCEGRHSHEKDIALDITLRLGQLIKRHHPDVDVIYTRKRDEFIPLHERANIANRNKADLFISVHCNTSAKRNSAIGTETFVMGLHRAEDNLEVAKRENASIQHEDDYEANYDGYDPNSDEAHITLSMYQNAFLDQSIMLANLIETEFKNHGQRVSRGVKQAGFLVLRNTVMPSVLVEAGFLNHNKEEAVLTSEEGKDRAAMSIFNAFTKYKFDMDKMAVASTTSSTIEAVPTSTHNETKIQEEPVNYVERAKREMERMKRSAEAQKQPKAKYVSTPRREVHKRPTTVNKPVSREPKATIASTSKQSHTTTAKAKLENRSSNIVPKEKILEYVVQLSASKNKFTHGGGKWDHVENVIIRFEGDLYKYQVGMMENYQKALETKSRLKKMGFNDCFIVAYYNDKQINVKDALAMSN